MEALTHPLSPFELAELQEFECGGRTVHSTGPHLLRHSSSVQRLVVHLPSMNHDPSTGFRSLVSLPGTRHLTINITHASIEILQSILALPSSQIEHLTLAFSMMRDSLQEPYATRLGFVLSAISLPALRRMEIVVRLNDRDPPRVETEAHFRAALAAWDQRGQLDITTQPCTHPAPIYVHSHSS
ncbi:hypothetical protein FB451DRAFT_1399880 [Mycena latifolia]|nr:hypothetical protein FB451DRAFT_1399880 [Mycena latifolia]